jgi:hypothetical protein
VESEKGDVKTGRIYKWRKRGIENESNNAEELAKTSGIGEKQNSRGL